MDFRGNTLISLLQNLSKDEINSLKKFISSPYFNTNKNITDFFEELIKFYPEFEGKNLNKENIYGKVFKDKPYNDSNMRWILSELTHLIENYFAQKRFDENKLLKDFYISEEFVMRMDENHFKKSIDTMKKDLNKVQSKDYMYFLYKYMCMSNELNEIALFKKDKKAKDMEVFFELYLKSFVSYINHFIIGITFDYLSANSLASKYLKNGISKKINDLVKLFNFEKVADFMEKNNDDAGHIRATINLLNIFLYPDNDSLYNNFKNNIAKNDDGLTAKELSGFYLQLIPYLRLKIVRAIDKDYFRNELFTITKFVFENNLQCDERTNSLNHTLYRITLLNILEMEKIEEAEIFINKYCNQISENHRKNSYNFSYAYLNFYKKDFDSTLNYMNKTDPNFFFTDQKILKIACFAELNYNIECANEVKSFRKYLKISKFLSPEIRKCCDKFLFFIPYICQSGKRKMILSKKKLLEKINEPDAVYLNNWLKEKIKGL